MPVSNLLPVRRFLACGLTVAVGFAAAALLIVTARSVSQAEAAVSEIVYPGCAPRIQQCLDNAAPGQTVVIQAGHYLTSLTLSKAVSLTGAGSAQVTLQALPDQRVLTVTGHTINNSVVISGLTLAGGQALGAACPAGCGGGMAVVGNAQPLIENVVLTDNAADHFGGGLYADTDSHVTLQDVRLISNSAAVGGGGAYLYPLARITGGEFRDNRSLGYGGGLVTSFILTLTGTGFISNVAIGDGGGLYAVGDTYLAGARFQSNLGQLGGGVYAATGATIVETEFLDNSADQGGGAFAQGPLGLTGGRFQGNHSSTAGGGQRALSSLSVTGTQFVGNTSDGNGGGIDALSAASLENVLFRQNISALDGGGLHTAGRVTLQGAEFEANQCTNAGCRGGGVFAGGDLTVTASEFRDNSAAQGGGLWHLTGAGLLANALFAGNRVSDTGAALYLNSAGHVRLVQSTIASPTLGAQAAINVAAGEVNMTNTIVASYSVGLRQTAGFVSEDYNLFASNGANLAGSVVIGVHQVSGDPKFADLNAGNYHLSSSSPALDAGTDAGLIIDFDGDPRPIGTGFDIGYDEFGTVLHLPVVSR